MTFFGTPIHPALVHLPLGLFLGAWILHVLSLWTKRESFLKAAMMMFVMAGFSTLITVPTGLLEQGRLHLHHPLVYAHRNFGILTSAAAFAALVLLWFLRSQRGRRALVFGIFCWLCAGLVLAAGYLGGEMVYKYAIGVQR